MKHRHATLILIFSLSFNIAFIIAWGAKRTRIQKPDPAPRMKSRSQSGDAQKKTLSPEWGAHYDRLREKLTPPIQRLRKDLAAERESLGRLLHDETADSTFIEDQLQRIGKLQLDIERRIVFFVLEERDLFSPKESKRYMDKVVKRIVDGGHTNRRNQSKADTTKTGRQEFP